MSTSASKPEPVFEETIPSKYDHFNHKEANSANWKSNIYFQFPGMQNLSISCSLVCLIILGSAALLGAFGVCQRQISAVLVTGVMYLLAGEFDWLLSKWSNIDKKKEEISTFKSHELIPRFSTLFLSFICIVHTDDHPFQTSTTSSVTRQRFWWYIRWYHITAGCWPGRPTFTQCPAFFDIMEPRPGLGWCGFLCYHLCPLDNAIQNHAI